MDSGDVELYLDAVANTAFTISSGVMYFTTTVAAGVNIRLQRRSPVTAKVDFQTGAMLTEDALETDSKQMLYLSEEARDRAEEAIIPDNDNTWDMGNRHLHNVPDPTAADHVATKSYLDNTFGTEVTTVSNSIADINSVASNITNVNTTASNIASVNTTASNQTAISTTASNITAITTCNTNIAEIIAAPSAATTATTQAGISTTQATNSSNSATASAGSATASSNSASASSTSANSSATSSTSALASKVAAATSETNAGTSATNAATSATTAASYIPSNSGESGKFLTNNGSVNSWGAVDALPSQTGNNGKYLGTDGSTATWNTLDTDANTTTKGLYEMAHTISSNYSISSSNNAMSAGPITVNASVSVTVPATSTWVIV
jgi:hypothetical protein